MRYGISAAAIIMQNQRLLLVNHRFERYNFWVPPGGKLESEESIFDCARREAFEETGLQIELERIVYIQEFVEPDYHFCKFFILCASFAGNITLAHRVPEEDFLIDARFVARDDIRTMTIFPEILRDQFWADVDAGFPQTRYLGLQHVQD